ncbi:MAG: Gfo/Idh/MocA family oxidoreductase [Armatimonadetes bacterium]|nr:Gfo/Idh/MocA family oxidoreductase [Armatimonadota bacterium]
MTRIGILSFAHHHAEAYVGNLRAIQDVEIIGTADDDRARGQEVAARSGLQLFTSAEDLLRRRPDGVIVCAENVRHRALVEMAARAGVHVLCEKPLATALADGNAMIDACARAAVNLMIAFPMRFSAPLLEIKRVLDDGRLGRIFCCNATNQGQNPRRHRAWFVQRSLAGGGAVTDHTVHLVDALRWLLGSTIEEVYAQTNEIMPSGGDVETAGLLSLRFRDGAFAAIDCSWSRPDSYPTWGGLAIELIGERGVIAADAFRQTLSRYPEQSPRVQWHYWGSDANQAMIEEFIASIRERRPPRVTGEDGYRALEVVVAAYESARVGQPVRIPAKEQPTDG